MKGVVFTEFMELVESQWGLDMVNQLVDEVSPNSGAAYTSVGTYDIQELLDYVNVLSNRTNTPQADLVKAFGTFLAGSFTKKFNAFFEGAKDSFELLKQVENHIHVEVRKLYPDAELPRFSFHEPDKQTLVLHYQSSHFLPDLAQGLIEGTAKYYGENFTINRDTQTADGEPLEVFTLNRQ